jgi:hypothetical protein
MQSEELVKQRWILEEDRGALLHRGQLELEQSNEVERLASLSAAVEGSPASGPDCTPKAFGWTNAVWAHSTSGLMKIQGTSRI